MANLALYIDLAAKTAVSGPNSTVPARLPELFQGDQIGVDLYFLTPTGDTFAPYTFNNYSGPGIRLGIGKVAPPTGGTFTITDTTSGLTTYALQFNASTGAVQTAFASIGRSVTVTGDYLTGYVIQFLAGTNFAQITASATNLAPDCVAIVKTIRHGATGISEVQSLKFQQLAGAYVDSWTPKLGSAPTATPSTVTNGNGAATTATVSTVQSGNGTTLREVQRITFGAAPVAGTFFLTFGGYGNTAAIDYNATAADIQATINALLGTNAVTVTLVPGVSFDITWASTFADQAQCSATSSLIAGTAHEVQRVTFSSPPVGGSFSLGFAAGNTDSIAWNASASDIAATINALLGDNAVSVTVVAGVSFDVVWGDYTNHAELTINSASLQWPYGFTGTLNLDTLGIDQMLGEAASVTDAILEVELTPSGGTPETVLQTNVTMTNDLLESSVYGSTPNPMGNGLATTNEISITGASTLTSSALGKMHVCSGTSADYTVVLPTAVGNAGKLIGLRMAAGLTKLVTLDGVGAETIDGALTRVMWAQESAILMSDGAEWTKIAGRSIPMAASMRRNAAQSFANGSYTKVSLDATSWSYGAIADLTNSRMTAFRPNRYTASVYGRFDSVAAAEIVVGCFVNGSEAFRASVRASAIQATGTAQTIDLPAAAVVELYLFQDSGSSQNTNTALSLQPKLVLVESPSW